MPKGFALINLIEVIGNQILAQKITRSMSIAPAFGS
jgi:hypothetical protein